MTNRLHALAGSLGLLCIALFWAATVVSELSQDMTAIVWVKTAIPWGLLVLIPAMIVVGASGFRLARGRTGNVIEAKRRRMPLIALNGMLVLVPCAFVLAAWAQAARFDSWFYAVQALELAAGALNLMLMGRNMRDGLRLTNRWRRTT
ncbi:hypothetical protein [Rhodovibrio salinarum]|uniref:Transmembrane protein n=1 Tax=Rhodovibrio salinarum TaxID=1087 RepID=A0A934QJL7_9PROT|nr:hypothetical protein [Rhodovibrio salinarum]MBK1698076.1 hypothetical protein [Rhodovibrio salinarum]